MRSKAYIALATIMVLLISMGIIAFAGEKEISVYVNNNRVPFDQKPIFQDNKVSIPFRDVVENLGYEVSYNKSTKKVVAKDKGDSIELTINSNKAIKNGKEAVLQEKIELFNNRIMVSKSFFRDVMGCEIEEIQELNSIVIHINKKNDISKHFKGYKGTFKLYNMKNKESIVYNKEDLDRRTPPASTYKIMNSLIALETGAVEDKDTLKKWDGNEYPIPEWNKDHTLSSAMKNSVVWYYQAVARDIGRERMQEYIDKVQYGNQIIGEEIHMFWVDGSLQISPMEQLDIVEKLYKEELPFKEKVIKTVKEMLISEEIENTILAGKTGTYVEKGKPKVGWYVGYVVAADVPYIFVTRLEEPDIGGDQPIGGWKAKLITIDILKELNIVKNK